jgi:alpha-ketoglutarate-dependent taurine dioxygenase
MIETTTLPLVIRSPRDPMSPIEWAAANQDSIGRALDERGALLLRGFTVDGVDRFREFVTTAGGPLGHYTYRSTPRTDLGDGIYSSTEYPADVDIPFHNEHSYARSWPMKLFFYCQQVAADGGLTPLADSHRVYERIPEAIRRRFREKKVMYVRNYGPSCDLPWQDVFQTKDPREVEASCRELGIQWEWQGAERLRTWQVCQAVARHPRSGKLLWFNQAHLFHVSSLGAEVMEALVETFGESNVPRNTFYGDGTPIELSALDEIRGAYEAERVAFAWEREDILVLDNMAVAHSRTPYSGERKVRVGMTEQVDGFPLDPDDPQN